ncbi:helix-turn-helix transcriptional regulator [Mycobacterium sp. LTG2003]
MWPLTGRDEEMSFLEAAIASELCGVVVRGGSGVGKSRIAREALARAQAGGCETRWVAATSVARGLPLGALAPWVGTAPGPVVGGVSDAITAAPRDKQVIVGVDDAHLLDDLSVSVLHEIVRRRSATLVVTLRDGEPIPPALQRLWESRRFGRLDLQPLSQRETAELMSIALGGPVDPQAGRRLWRLTRGNALYLRNVVEHEIACGRMAERDGSWRWVGDPVLPPGLVELIETRLAGLSTRIRDVIDTLAVGEPIEWGALTGIVDRVAVDEAEALGLIALDHLETNRHLVEVRAAHPLYTEVRRNNIAQTRLRQLRGALARELGLGADSDEAHVVVRRALLELESDSKPDPELLITAAKSALWLVSVQSPTKAASAASLAGRLAVAAYEAGAGAEARFVRAYSLTWLGDGERADALLAGIPVDELADSDAARVAFLRAFNRLFALADPAGARAVLDAHPGPDDGCLDALLRVHAATMGEPEPDETSSEKLDLMKLPDLIAARIKAWAVTVVRGEAGRTAEAQAAAHAGYAVPVRSFVIVADAHVSALLLAGHIAEAMNVAEQVLGRPGDGLAGNPAYVAVVDGIWGRLALASGRPVQAQSQLLASALENYPGAVNGWAYRCQIPRTIALAMSGATDEAVSALRTAEEHRHPSWRYLDYELGIARAWVAAAQGAVSQAISDARKAAEWARETGKFAAEVMCLQTAVQFGDRSCGGRLSELAAVVEGPRVELMARLATALRDGNAVELLAVSHDCERIGDLVAAADAAAHASRVFRRGDRNGSAMGALSRARTLAVQCGASTPALRAAANPVQMSAREREVAMLVGRGLSSRDIAERLSLSVRTVEGHIYRAMTKTGAADRAALAAIVNRAEGAN